MKKITALLLLLSLTLSLAACAPGQSPDEQPEPGQNSEDIVPTPEQTPVPDPAETYEVTESDAEGVFEKTGVYFFGIDTIESVSHRLIGAEELDEPIGEMSFSSGDGLAVTYRVRRDSMINADQAKFLFGERDWEAQDSVRIGSSVSALYYNEGGEAILCWYDINAGVNCCARYSASDSREDLVLYGNLLSAFVNSEVRPE